MCGHAFSLFICFSINRPILLSFSVLKLLDVFKIQFLWFKKGTFVQKKVDADVLVTQATVKEALDMLRGAIMIVYPMGLPPHEPIRQEFENNEDLSGKQV